MLVRLRERWRSIAMSTFVCLSVCLSARISPEPHAWCLPLFRCMLPMAWLGPPPTGWRNPKEKGQFWGFSSPLTVHCHALLQMGAAEKGVMGVHSAGEVWSTIALFVFWQSVRTWKYGIVIRRSGAKATWRSSAWVSVDVQLVALCELDCSNSLICGRNYRS